MVDAASGEREAEISARLTATRFGPVRLFDQLDSTNRYVVDEAARGARDGLVVVADVQHAGRGRLGRSWVAPPGASLLVSVLVRVPGEGDHRGLASPAAALAASDALRALSGIDARLKWPNDLVVGDRKLAGLLAETVSARPDLVVLGMGLNVAWPSFPDDLAAIATACNLCSDRTPARDDLLVAWLGAYDERLAALGSPAGRGALRDACAARSATLGRRVRVELPARAIEGTATGLTPDGYLEVTTDHGVVETIGAGDVVHLRAAPTD